MNEINCFYLHYRSINLKILMIIFHIHAAQIPNVDQLSCSTNKHPEFVSVIYDPFIILDAYWSEEQIQGFDLHLGFVHLGCTN